VSALHPRSRLLLAFLALGALVALSGCSAAGDISLHTVENDTVIAQHATDDLPNPHDEEARNIRQALRTAAEDGSAVIRNQTYPPAETDQPYLIDGTVYQLNRTVVDEREVPVVDIRIDYNATDTDGEAVQFSSLPESDRRALDGVLPPRSDRRVEGYDIGTRVRYEDPSESELLGGETVVVYEGERYLVDAERDGTRTLSDYRYTATELGSAAAYGRSLREQYTFTLSDLSKKERKVLEEARDGSYYADSDSDEAFASVLERFKAHEAVIEREGEHGEWLVRWDGKLYWAEIYYGGFE
jgi:hypothetical protein